MHAISCGLSEAELSRHLVPPKSYFLKKFDVFWYFSTYISLCDDCSVKICKLTIFSCFAENLVSLMALWWPKPRYGPTSYECFLCSSMI